MSLFSGISSTTPSASKGVFLGDVEFSKDRPTNVILSDELEDLYRKPHITELGRLMEAFQPHWEKVEEARERAPTVVAQF